MPGTFQVLLQMVKWLTLAYLIICILLYFIQERLIFFPEKLGSDYRFQFRETFEEMMVPTKRGNKLSAVLFPADSSRGLIFYLHGNGGLLLAGGKLRAPIPHWAIVFSFSTIRVMVKVTVRSIRNLNYLKIYSRLIVLFISDLTKGKPCFWDIRLDPDQLPIWLQKIIPVY